METIVIIVHIVYMHHIMHKPDICTIQYIMYKLKLETQMIDIWQIEIITAHTNGHIAAWSAWYSFAQKAQPPTKISAILPYIIDRETQRHTIKFMAVFYGF